MAPHLEWIGSSLRASCGELAKLAITCMRPEILNPAFHRGRSAEGRRAAGREAVEKARPDPLVDLLYHLPTGAIERMRAPARAPPLLGRNIILDLTPFDMREPRSGRGPMRVFAADGEGNTISLIYFNNPGWAKRSLPLGQLRTVSGKLEAYGDEWQIIHPEVSEPGKGAEPALREPVYPLTEGLTNRRLGRARRDGTRTRARSARMDRAGPGRARRLARVASVAGRGAPRTGRRACAPPPRL